MDANNYSMGRLIQKKTIRFSDPDGFILQAQYTISEH